MNMSNLKIAIQMYGHLRTFELCAPALKEHVLNHYDCDVFIHTWDKTEHSTQSWYVDSMKSTVRAVDSTILAKIKQFYAPKLIKVEPQGFLDEKGHFGTHASTQISLVGLKYMLYSQYQANLLREAYQHEHGIAYDYVVVLRPDILPYEKLNFERFSQEFAFNPRTSIHLVHRAKTKILDNKIFNYPKMADCYYFSTAEVISQITQLYTEFDRYYKAINMIFPAGVENPETAFFEYIYQHNIIPRQYISYFALKRHNKKDDIKLLPPKTANKNKIAFLFKIKKFIFK
ncbi:MAG: hypothetical protein Tsb005_04580 [Gammaproteobacteria bacterium]